MSLKPLIGIFLNNSMISCEDNTRSRSLSLPKDAFFIRAVGSASIISLSTAKLNICRMAAKTALFMRTTPRMVTLSTISWICARLTSSNAISPISGKTSLLNIRKTSLPPSLRRLNSRLCHVSKKRLTVILACLVMTSCLIRSRSSIAACLRFSVSVISASIIALYWARLTFNCPLGSTPSLICTCNLSRLSFISRKLSLG